MTEQCASVRRLWHITLNLNFEFEFTREVPVMLQYMFNDALVTDETEKHIAFLKGTFGKKCFALLWEKKKIC